MHCITILHMLAVFSKYSQYDRRGRGHRIHEIRPSRWSRLFSDQLRSARVNVLYISGYEYIDSADSGIQLFLRNTIHLVHIVLTPLLLAAVWCDAVQRKTCEQKPSRWLSCTKTRFPSMVVATRNMLADSRWRHTFNTARRRPPTPQVPQHNTFYMYQIDFALILSLCVAGEFWILVTFEWWIL